MATKMTYAQMVTAINENIVDNTEGLITPAVLRNLLLNLAISVYFGTHTGETRKSITYVEGAPVTVTFPTAFAVGVVPSLDIRAYTSTGGNVDYQITELTNTGFKILPAETCYIDYAAETLAI